jgi:hypothetical protein
VHILALASVTLIGTIAVFSRAKVLMLLFFGTGGAGPGIEGNGVFLLIFQQFPTEVISMILLIVSRIWRANRRFAFGILAICCTLVLAPIGNGQTNQSNQENNDNSKPLIDDSAAVQLGVQPTPAGEATVYIYRTKKYEGSLVTLAIFINGNYSAEMKKMEYVQVKVPPGKTFITTAAKAASVSFLARPTSIFNGPKANDLLGPREIYVHIPTTTDRWTSLPDCATLDWQRLWVGEGLKDSERADAARCEGALQEIIAKLTEALRCGKVSDELIQLCSIPHLDFNPLDHTAGYSRREATYCRKEMELSIEVMHGRTLPAGTHTANSEFEVEAGKTYYVDWEFFSRGAKMKLVDDATGTKEIGMRQLAK